MDPLAEPALAAIQALGALGNESTRVELGTFVRNLRAPQIWEANHVTGPRAATDRDVERLLAQVDEHYAGLHHRRIDVGVGAPGVLEARLARDGWVERRFDMMVLEGELRGRRRRVDIRPIRDRDGWAACETLRAVAWAEEAGRLGLSGDPEVGAQLALVFRAKVPPVRGWLAHEDGDPCGYFASWEGIGGIGQVDDLFVHPARRHRGIATALVHHCVGDARAHGAGPVVLVADPNDTPREMYAAMGFRRLATKRDWLRLD
jgi:ribosomal protein S18 acetylase RimI-like enzyme